MVRWSRSAKKDLKQVFDFISRDSKYYAQKVVLAIIEKSDALGKFPYRGRVVPERNEESIRELLIYSYRMIYQINSDKIEILALIHSKKDVNSIEFNEPQT